MGKNDCPQCGQDMRLPPIDYPHSCLDHPDVRELISAGDDYIRNVSGGYTATSTAKALTRLRTALARVKEGE